MQRLKPLLATAIILLLTAACGQKGPLFLPQEAGQAEESQPEEKDKPDEKNS